MEIPKFCRRFDCERPDIRVLDDNEFNTTLACMTCKSTQILTKPRGWARTAYEQKLKRLGRVHSWEAKTLYSLPGRKK
jgi:hypothetical protein